MSAENTDRTPVANADVCVVGAGPAGALVADRLAADHEVIVLDAGPGSTPRTGSTVRNERSGRVTTAPMSGTWAGSATRTATPASGSTR